MTEKDDGKYLQNQTTLIKSTLKFQKFFLLNLRKYFTILLSVSNKISLH